MLGTKETRVRTIRRFAVVAVLMLALAALAVVPVGAQSSTVKVKIGDNYFKPKKLSVEAGTTIIWKWTGTAIHDVASKGKNPEKFMSKKQADGKYRRQLLTPGKYKIVCTLHPGMEMKVTVVETVATTTTSSSAPPAT
jgi:plastocyanin